MFKIIKVLLFCSITSFVFGHGLVVDPPSRNALCGLNEKPDNATTQACIDAFKNDPNGGYQFMSVLTHTEGRAVATTLPENVCSFDSEVWSGASTPWDVPTNWPSNPIQPGPMDITWNISWGNHFGDTREFHYWITKPEFEFSPTTALKWTDFEETPFCVQKYDDSNPTANPNVVSDKEAVTFTTTCVVPARNGHQVIYGEWGRNSWTYERFHSCIDVEFGGSTSIAPTANSQNVTLVQDTSLAIALIGQDSDGQITAYNVATNPTSGTLTGTGASLIYTPDAGYFGVDAFNFTVTDNDGLTSVAATVGIQVTKTGNTAPVAAFYTSINGLDVTFDGSASTDADNDPLTYAWNFGDGHTGQGGTISHAYAAAGTYSVVLTVNDGANDSVVTKDVAVTTLPPSQTQCEYVIVNEWESGFIAEIRILNAGTVPLSGWRVDWVYSADSSTVITNSWNGIVTGTGPYTATNESWNGTIAPQQQVSLGFQGAKTGPLTLPVLSGDVCN